MFVAKRENGQLLSLAIEKERNNLQKLRENEQFFCPCCNERVILKLGYQRSFHFAHLQGSQCSFQIEPESDYHMSGKLQLYEWLKKKRLNPELEPFLNDIKQRPDIMFFYKGKCYVIEFQCSPISSELFSKRTKNYYNNNILPLWVLGTNSIVRRSANIFALSNFQSLFLVERQKEWRLTYYSPLSKKFIILKQLIPLSVRNVYGRVSVVNKQQMPINELIINKSNENITINKTTIQKSWQLINNQMKNYPLRRRAYKDLFLNELYNSGLTIDDLTTPFGLPVQSSIQIQTPTFIWQFYIYLDNFHNKKISELVYFQDIVKNFKKRIQTQHIKLRKPLFFKNSYYTCAIHQYVQILIDLKILLKLDSDTLKLKANFVRNNYNSSILTRDVLSSLYKSFTN